VTNSRILRNKKITFAATAVTAVILLWLPFHSIVHAVAEYPGTIFFQRILTQETPGHPSTLGPVEREDGAWATKELFDERAAELSKSGSWGAQIVKRVYNGKGGDVNAGGAAEVASDTLKETGLGIIDLVLGRVIAVIGVLMGLLLSIVSIFFKIMFNMIAKTLLAVLGFNNFTGKGMEVIDTVWKAMRDLANMFFIVVLLIIAFGTMLRIEKYNYKQLLPKLMIMAVLVNFSRTIAGFFIDVSQVVMLTFFDAIKSVETGNFQQLFAIGFDQLNLSGDAFMSFAGLSSEGPMLIVAAQLMAFMYLVTGTTMMLSILGLLAFRIVALWVLIMFSPLAFFLSTFPQGEEYSGMWWKQFSANVIIGPVLAFFLWLALLVNQDVEYSATAPAKGGIGQWLWGKTFGITEYKDIIQGLNDPKVGEIFVGSFDLLKFVNVLLSFTILSVGMMIAQQIGSAGAKMVEGAASTVNGWGMAAWQKPAKFLGGGVANWVDRSLAAQSLKGGKMQYFAYFSPTVIKKAFTAHMEGQETDKFTHASGVVQNTIDKRMNMGLGMGGVPAALSWLLKNAPGAGIKTDAEGKVLNADAGGMKGWIASKAKELDAAGLTEFWSGHAGLAEQIATEVLIEGKVSKLGKSNIDEPAVAEYLYANRGSGNVIENEANIRHVGANQLGDGVAAQMLKQHGMPLVSALTDTDRQGSTGNKRTNEIWTKNRGGSKAAVVAEQMVRDPEATMDASTPSEDDLRKEPEFDAIKKRIDETKTPEESVKLAHELGIQYQGLKSQITGEDPAADAIRKKTMDAIKQAFKDVGSKMVEAINTLHPESKADKGIEFHHNGIKSLKGWIDAEKTSGKARGLTLDRLIHAVRTGGGGLSQQVIKLNGGKRINLGNRTNDTDSPADEDVKNLTQNEMEEFYAKLRSMNSHT